MRYLKENIFQILGLIFGAIFGYFYWKNSVCNANVCMINSTPFPLTINFAILGYLLGGIIKPYIQKIKINGKN